MEEKLFIRGKGGGRNAVKDGNESARACVRIVVVQQG